MDKFLAAIQLTEKTFKQVSFGLVTLMLVCAGYTLVTLLNHLLPEWQPWYLIWLIFLITLERIYTYRRFRDMNLLSREGLITLGTEWVVILAVIKLVAGLSRGPGNFALEISLWAENFSAYFFSPEYLFACLLVLAVWLISGEFADQLDEMGYAQALLAQQFPALEAGKAPVRARLLNLVFSLGAVLILFTALIRVDLRAIFTQGQAIPFKEISALAEGGASTLLYFMLGLVLFSQTQFMDLHTRWSLQNIPVNRSLATRWAGYSLVFLGLIAGIVSLLPTSYSLGLLYLLGYGLSFISSFFLFLGQAIITLIFVIYNLILMLFGKDTPADQFVPETPQFQPPSGEGLLPTEAPAWWEILKSAGFWIIFGAVLIFSVLQYLRQHQEILAVLRKIPGANLLARLSQWLRGFFAGAQTTLARVVEASRQRLRRGQASAGGIFRGGFFNLRELDPRQKVFFYYQALLRRSGESGLPRRPAQTPNEFATALEAALPNADEDIASLTEAFIEARYTRQPVGPEQANRVREYWEHLKKALRGKKEKSGK